MRNKINEKSLTLKEIFQIGGWEEFLSVADMAKKLGIHKSSVLARVRKGHLDSVTLYNFLLVRKVHGEGINGSKKGTLG